jgi:uncharacterized protein with FMN-binding domain
MQEPGFGRVGTARKRFGFGETSGGDQMKRIVLVVMCTVTIVVLLFGYHTSSSSRAVRGQTSFVAGAHAGTSATAPSNGALKVTTVSASAATGASTLSTAGNAASASGSSVVIVKTGATTNGLTRSVTGHVFDTRWGPVQVQATVVSGRIVSVAVVQYPNGNERDREINARALPILVQETIVAQSADIDMVSSATVTSDGYLGSLQSVLDQM